MTNHHSNSNPSNTRIVTYDVCDPFVMLSETNGRASDGTPKLALFIRRNLVPPPVDCSLSWYQTLGSMVGVLVYHPFFPTTNGMAMAESAGRSWT